MKTLLVSIFLLSLAAYGLYEQQQQEQSLELQQQYGVDIDSLYCIYGHIVWNLEHQDLTDESILEMAQVMDSGKFQELCAEFNDDVTQIELYLNKNPKMNDFSPLLSAINRNFAETNERIFMDLSYNEIENWDQYFEGWQIPAKVNEIEFSFLNNQSSSIKNFNTVLSKKTSPTEILYLDVTRNGVSKDDLEELVSLINKNKNVNGKIQLYFGYDLEGDTLELKQGLLDIIKNSPKLYWIDLYLQGYQFTEEQLQTLADSLIEAKKTGELFIVYLNLSDCGIPSKKVHKIFEQVSRKFVHNFHLIA